MDEEDLNVTPIELGPQDLVKELEQTKALAQTLILAVNHMRNLKFIGLYVGVIATIMLILMLFF